MGQVAIRVNGRTYRLRCGDGEETRLLALGAHIGDKVDALVKDFGQIGEDKLLLMAALLICDEYFDARDRRATTGVTEADAAVAASG
jgi:cell division protein ZapA